MAISNTSLLTVTSWYSSAYKSVFTNVCNPFTVHTPFHPNLINAPKELIKAIPLYHSEIPRSPRCVYDLSEAALNVERVSESILATTRQPQKKYVFA